MPFGKPTNNNILGSGGLTDSLDWTGLGGLGLGMDMSMGGATGMLNQTISKLPAGLPTEQVVTSVPTGGVFTHNTHTDGSNNQPKLTSTYQNYNNVANPMTGSFVDSAGNPYGTDHQYNKQGNNMFTEPGAATKFEVPRGHTFEENNSTGWKRDQLAEDGSKLYTGKYEKQYLEGNNTIKGIGDNPGRGGFRVTTPKVAPLAAVAPNSGAFKNDAYNWNGAPSAPVAAAPQPDIFGNVFNPSMNQGKDPGMFGLGVVGSQPPEWDHDNIFDFDHSSASSDFGGDLGGWDGNATFSGADSMFSGGDSGFDSFSGDDSTDGGYDSGWGDDGFGDDSGEW